MKTLNIIFYILLILPIIWELIKLVFNKKAFEYYKETVNGVINENVQVQSGIEFIYFLLMVGGLVTFQWELFGLILLLASINKNSRFTYIVDSIFCILVLSFVIVNRFHLHWQF